MDGAGVAVQIPAQVVVHFVGIGTYGQAADFQYDLIAAGGMDGACGEQKLHTRPGGDRIDVPVVVKGDLVLLGAPDTGKEFLFVKAVCEAAVGPGLLSGHEDVIALVLPAQLIIVGLHIGPARVDLYGHVAAGVVGIVVIEADREVAVELFGHLFAHQPGPCNLYEEIEGEFHLE